MPEQELYWWQDRNLTTHTERYATDHQASNDAMRATDNGWIVVSQSVEESGPPLGPLAGSSAAGSRSARSWRCTVVRPRQRRRPMRPRRLPVTDGRIGPTKAVRCQWALPLPILRGLDQHREDPMRRIITILRQQFLGAIALLLVLGGAAYAATGDTLPPRQAERGRQSDQAPEYRRRSGAHLSQQADEAGASREQFPGDHEPQR